MSKVEKGSKVKVHYTGKLADGSVFDSSEGREPLEFEVGAGMMIAGFDKGVEGMSKDENKTIVIPAAEAYGEYNNELVFDISKNQLPPDLQPEIGMELMSQQPNGQQMVVTVKEVKDEGIVIDANHKLAGKELTFNVKVVEIG